MHLWHKWSKWETFSKGEIVSYYHNKWDDSRVEESKRVVGYAVYQKRDCTKCGKIQLNEQEVYL